MKKLIILLTVVLLASCSKSDENENPILPLTFQNLVGKWNYKSVVRTNGSVVPFVSQCPTLVDYVEIFTNHNIITYNYTVGCTTSENHGTNNYYFDSNNVIYADGILFDTAKITNLTANSFSLEFAQPKPLTFMINVTDAKSIIFERR